MEISLYLGVNIELESKGIGTKLLPEKLWGIEVLGKCLLKSCKW